MTPRANALLDRSRRYMEEAVGRLEEMDYAMGMNGDDARAHADSMPGEHGAMNVAPTHDDLDAYIMGIADVLLQEYRLEEGEAVDFVFEKADELAESGELPAVPDDDASDDEATEWLSQAKSLGFSSYVLKRAHEESEEDELE